MSMNQPIWRRSTPSAAARRASSCAVLYRAEKALARASSSSRRCFWYLAVADQTAAEFRVGFRVQGGWRSRGGAAVSSTGASQSVG